MIRRGSLPAPPMDIALSPTAPGLSADAILDLCRRAEAAGVRHAWLAEVAGPEAMAMAGAVTAGTGLAVGIAVVAAAARTPALLAMAGATLSQLGSGRPVSLGIGSSSEIIVSGWHGADFHPPLARTVETLLATRALLDGERSFEGDHVTSRGFRLAAPPAGPVPLYLGALGPRMLQAAGAHADGVCLNLMSPQTVARQLAEVANGAAQHGRALPSDYGVMARLHVVPGDDLDTGRDVIRHAFGPYFAQPVYNRFLAWSGHAEAAEEIAAGFAEGDRTRVAAAMSDQLVDDVALVGPPERISARLDEFATAGIGLAALNVIGADPIAVLQAVR